MSNFEPGIAQNIIEMNNNCFSSSIEKFSIVTSSVILDQMIIIFFVFIIKKKLTNTDDLILFIIAFSIILISLIFTIIIHGLDTKNFKCTKTTLLVILSILNFILFIYSIMVDISADYTEKDKYLNLGERTVYCLETYSFFHIGIYCILSDRIEKGINIPEKLVFDIQKIESINYQGQRDDSNIFSDTNIELVNKIN